MLRATARLCAGVALVAPIVVYGVFGKVSAQSPTAKPSTPSSQTKTTSAMPKMSGAAMTDAQKIANAMSAAPAEIGKAATIMDWPAEMGKGQPRQLRAGTNGWVCYPRTAQATSALGEDPMCLDKAWQDWAGAYMSKGTPKPASGIGYMLKGDVGASNTDPFATAPSATNQWVVSPSHIMVLYPDPKMLDAFPTDPKNGGPWVMWKGTPYAHLMVPISTTKTATMK
jgi:hypothetical protein